ncbi:MAG: hypothetical protein GX154_04435 [Clostridiales bacterium]|nr:hypothetical protein [Clostridiales bacterium]
MFEDKRKIRIKKVIMIFGFIFIVVFIGSYILNKDLGPKENNNASKVNKNIIIPKEIKSYDNNEDKNSLYRINESTKLCYLSLFKMCGHEIERQIQAPGSLYGLNIEELKDRIDGWEISEVKDNNIILIREFETYCPKHFIIGVLDNNIAIYTYNENGEKILKEKTDIDINILTPDDQVFLTNGIVADTEDDMEQKLEGFSN